MVMGIRSTRVDREQKIIHRRMESRRIRRKKDGPCFLGAVEVLLDRPGGRSSIVRIRNSSSNFSSRHHHPRKGSNPRINSSSNIATNSSNNRNNRNNNK